ncbi:hypothetical protein HYH02_012784 [Chlamydomonas schloesseri]|uniref:Uncharacterized protein n=1 Tax=Chlamydomonas schloesseri TaxID=2026947 RepID=A0A835T5Y6_9CHLO|nr:hypothetical protein HYH02_012784 [Chlamydomonas schloesseri]|eukprot:KAG2433080.1 hypothetical protein HYH02_012784 [Chlamydomonas schloesseri]
MAPSRAPLLAGPALPEPLGSSLEINFRRLLNCCLRHLQTLEGAGEEPVSGEAGQPGAAAGPRDGSDTAALVLKMKHYVDTLREQLSDLKAQQEELGLDAARLELYEQHVKAVAAAVPRVQLPAYCQNLVAGGASVAAAAAAIAASSSGATTAAAAAAGAGKVLQPPAPFFKPPVARPGVVSTSSKGGKDAADSSGGDGREEAVPGTAGLSAAAAERLRSAEAAQALLTDELAELTAALKANAVGMSAAVAERGRLLDATDTALGESLAATKKNAAAAGEQVKRSGGTFCLTLGILLVVGLVFSGMVVYIKATHMVGYRAQPRPRGGGAGSAGSGGGSAAAALGHVLGERFGVAVGSAAKAVGALARLAQKGGSAREEEEEKWEPGEAAERWLSHVGSARFAGQGHEAEQEHHDHGAEKEQEQQAAAGGAGQRHEAGHGTDQGYGHGQGQGSGHEAGGHEAGQDSGSGSGANAGGAGTGRAAAGTHTRPGGVHARGATIRSTARSQHHHKPHKPWNKNEF